MKKYNSTVFVDMDGVISDFESEFCDRFGYDNRNLYDLFSRYPEIDPALIEEFINSPESYENLVPIFGGAVALLGLLRSRGVFVTILTARPKKLAEVTRTWLEGYEIQYNELWYARNKHIAIQEYNQMYPKRAGSLLIDDSPSHLQIYPIKGIAWEQPWNEGFYPRMRYNPDNMQIEVKSDTVSEWTRF